MAKFQPCRVAKRLVYPCKFLAGALEAPGMPFDLAELRAIAEAAAYGWPNGRGLNDGKTLKHIDARNRYRDTMTPAVALALVTAAEAAREYLTGDPRVASKARGDLHVAVAALEAALKEHPTPRAGGGDE